jgi:hypothetical protein
MHGVKLTAKEYPGILMDVSFDKNGISIARAS